MLNKSHGDRFPDSNPKTWVTVLMSYSSFFARSIIFLLIPVIIASCLIDMPDLRHLRSNRLRFAFS